MRTHAGSLGLECLGDQGRKERQALLDAALCLAWAKSREAPVVVEPNPALRAAISRTFEAGAVELALVQAAATGGSSEPSRLGVAGNYWWSSIEERPGLPLEEVASGPFQELIGRHRPAVVAIDIEGHEPCVRPILFEIHTPDLGAAETARIVPWLQGGGLQDARPASQQRGLREGAPSLRRRRPRPAASDPRRALRPFAFCLPPSENVHAKIRETLGAWAGAGP